MTIELAVNNEFPEELRQQLSKKYLVGTVDAKQFHKTVMSFFSDKDSLTLDELIVLWWRENGDVLKRNATNARMQRLVKEGELVSDRGVYTLPKGR